MQVATHFKNQYWKTCNVLLVIFINLYKICLLILLPEQNAVMSFQRFYYLIDLIKYILFGGCSCTHNIKFFNIIYNKLALSNLINNPHGEVVYLFPCLSVLI